MIILQEGEFEKHVLMLKCDSTDASVREIETERDVARMVTVFLIFVQVIFGGRWWRLSGACVRRAFCPY